MDAAIRAKRQMRAVRISIQCSSRVSREMTVLGRVVFNDTAR